MRTKIKFLSAGAALVLSAGAASAAVVTGDLNLRSGPGTQYSVIDTMPAGAQVAVLSCGGSWCRVNWRGELGYASRNFIAGERGPSYSYEYAPGYVYDNYGYYSPGVVFGFGNGYYGGHRGGAYGGRNRHRHHGNTAGPRRTGPTLGNDRGGRFRGRVGAAPRPQSRGIHAAPRGQTRGTVGAGGSAGGKINMR